MEERVLVKIKLFVVIILILIISGCSSLPKGSMIVLQQKTRDVRPVKKVSFFISNTKSENWMSLYEQALGLQEYIIDDTKYNSGGWMLFEGASADMADIWIQITPTDMIARVASLEAGQAGALVGVAALGMPFLALTMARSVKSVHMLNVNVKIYEPNTKKLIGSMAISSGECDSDEHVYEVIKNNLMDYIEGRVE